MAHREPRHVCVCVRIYRPVHEPLMSSLSFRAKFPSQLPPCLLFRSGMPSGDSVEESWAHWANGIYWRGLGFRRICYSEATIAMPIEGLWQARLHHDLTKTRELYKFETRRRRHCRLNFPRPAAEARPFNGIGGARLWSPMPGGLSYQALSV